MEPLSLAAFGLSALGGAYQIGSGLAQKKKANNLEYQDTRTDADKEALALARQQANSQRMPGIGLAIDNINQSSANARNAAIQAGTSSSNILAANSQIHKNDIQGLNQLNSQSAAYQETGKRNLTTEMRRDAALQQRDRESYERAKAGLKQAANTNIFGGLSSLASTALYGMDYLDNKKKEDKGGLDYNNGISLGGHAFQDYGAGGYKFPMGVSNPNPGSLRRERTAWSPFDDLGKLNFR